MAKQKAKKGQPSKWVEFIPKDSTQIAKLRFDKANNVLQTTFYHGGTYEYEGVSREIYREIKKADSVGSKHHKLIVSAGFKGKKLN